MFLQRSTARRGSILPLLAICSVAIFAMVALAIDLGVIAVARNHCQNAADIAALTGVRMLNGDTAANNNYSAVQPAAEAAGSANVVVGTAVTTSQVSTEIGYYAYNSTAGRFQATFNGSKPANEAWGAVRATVDFSQPTFFARIFGLTTMPATATATAVHRPRDVIIVLDFSGSMRFSSQTAYPTSGDITGSLNPDPQFPKFAHWSTLGGVMQRTTMYVDSGGETHAANNLTIDTENGPAVVKDFLTRDGSGNLINAFYRVTSPYDPTTWACPAPADWDVQSDTTATYGGSSGKGGDKAVFKSKASSGTYAATVQEYLFGTNNNATYTSATHVRSTSNGPGGEKFDPANPSAPTAAEGYGPSFKGYSMGPGYYGKTFYHWPPDPRWHSSNTSLQLDWRKKFFYKTGTTTRVDDNSVLWDSSGNWRQANQTGTYDINYNAVVAWLKSGPQVLPSNLRAGRVLYYSAIPDTIPASGGTEDQVFWRNYINYVIGAGSSTRQKRTLYGRSSSAWGTAKITALSALNTDPAVRPYMHYNDNPIRPRLHFWFGPLTMLAFLTENNDSSFNRNWWPGTCHESQTWQLKVGISSALTDIQKNHPNDWAALIHFSDIGSYGTPRVTLGRDYDRMRNALFYPFSLLDKLSDPNAEVRPYNSSFGSTAAGEIPNADGGTTPEMGFKAAYNQLSSKTGYNGRRGAARMVIFETDGVPNTYGEGVFTPGGAYNSEYVGITNGVYVANGDPGVLSRAKDAVTQIMALDTAAKPGYSSARIPARVHAIAFGDLFQSSSSTKTMALNFLLDVAKIGGTAPASATSLESYKIITGPYDTRIDNLRLALERIMQSGVQVSLIQ